MTYRWVLNASPLICLARAGFDRLLSEIPEEVVLPKSVAFEILVGPPDDPARKAIEAGKYRIVDAQDRPEIMAWDLGRGETAVLSYALDNPGWEAILDDNAARKCARSLSIGYRGTLAVVIMAKQGNLIPSAAGVLHALQVSGLRLDGNIIRKALKDAVDEEW